MAEIDNSDLAKLASDLGRTSDAAWKNMQTAIEVTARHVRDTARENATGMAHAPAFPYSITYDVGVGYDQSIGQAAMSVISGGISSARSSTLRAEIGPDKDRPQGALGNLIEYGSVHNPPQGIMHGALQANEADFEKGIDKSIDDALKKAGL
jgi:hypothetical protein